MMLGKKGSFRSFFNMLRKVGLLTKTRRKEKRERNKRKKEKRERKKKEKTIEKIERK